MRAVGSVPERWRTVTFATRGQQAAEQRHRATGATVVKLGAKESGDAGEADQDGPSGSAERASSPSQK